MLSGFGKLRSTNCRRDEFATTLDMLNRAERIATLACRVDSSRARGELLMNWQKSSRVLGFAAAAIGVLGILGWIFGIGQKEGWFETGLGTAVFVTTIILCLTLAVWWTARALEAAEIRRRTVEENLQRSQRELSDFFENSALALHWVGPDGKVLRVNDTELKMLGYTREEYVGRNISDFHADLPVIEDILQRLTRGETLSDYPARLRCKDGSIRDVLIHSNVYQDEGKFIHTRCFTRDVSDLKQAEAARAQLAAIVDSSEDAIVSKNLDGIVRSWNAGAERIFGYAAVEMIGESIMRLIPPDRQSEENEILRSLRAGERMEHFETVRVTKDGRLIDVSLTTSPVRDVGGTVIGASKIVRDITQQKQEEADIEQQRQWFAVTLSSIGDAVIAADAAGFVAFLNPVAETLTGWSSEEAVGRPLTTVFRLVDEETGAAETPIPRVGKDGGPAAPASRLALVAREGSVTPIENSAAPILSSEGDVLGTVMVFHDATERRRAEAAQVQRMRWVALRAELGSALTASEDLPAVLLRCAEVLQGHFEASAVRIWLVDPSTQVLEQQTAAGSELPERCAPALLQIGESYLGRIVERGAALVSPDVANDPNLPETDRAELEGIGAFAGQPLLLDGHAVGIVAVFAPRMLAPETAGELARAADSIAPWIQRKRSEVALRLARDAAEAASRAKDKFLAALSHELRTPLTPVLLLASEMEVSEDLPAGVREDFAMVRKNVELEARIIDDLLDLTRITQGKLALRAEIVDAHVLVVHALEILRSDLEAKGLTVNLELTAPDYQVSGDAVRLQQVFWNVLKNAVKFTPESGHITVRSAIVDGRLRIATEDSGLGITESEMPRIFDAFAQGDDASGARFGGLGLGLAISALLVREHQGSIWAESAGRGQGATFHLELPLAAVPTPEPAPTLPAAAAGAWPLRILLVEDHQTSREMIARLLTRRGHAVEAAGNVAEARELAAQHGIDLLVSDLGLPDGHGHELMRELRPQVVLGAIALSGYGMEADVEQSKAAGFDEHLTKPVVLADLEAAIQRIVSARRDTSFLPRSPRA